MVSQNSEQEAVQAPLPDIDDGGGDFTPTDNPIIAEVDRLNSVPEPEAEVETPIAPAPEPTRAPEVPQQAPVNDVPEPQPIQPTQPPQPSPQELQQMAQQAEQYQQVQARAQLQQEAQRYQQQLESQGYLPDQAQQLAHNYMQTKSAQVEQQRQHEYNTQVILGKQAAAEHFARQYNLTFDDMATLRLSNDPQQMEQVAKKIADDKKVRDELSQLKQQQVPPQQYDNSQGAPEVASSDGSWLDRYNAGDRSPYAVAAARRVLGM